MKPTISEIMLIAFHAMDQMRMSGHSLKRCVWEMSPSIITILFDNMLSGCKYDPDGEKIARFAGIPIRRGVTDESTGIMLKLVNSYWAG